MASTITVPAQTLLMFNEVKMHEAVRVREPITHEEFVLFLIKLYKRVGGDSLVLDAAWEKVKAEGN